MPRPRLEIAELFVHLVELSERLGDQAVRRTMIGEEIVADAVPARPPQKLVAVETEEIAGVCMCAQSRSSNAVWKWRFEPVSTRLMV